MKEEILLQLQNVSVNYGGVKALASVDVAFDEGEIVALIGPNGAGKSTVLKAIFGLAPIAHGKALWHNISFKPIPHESVDMGIAFVPQGRRVFSDLTVKENLEIGGFTIRDKSDLQRRIKEIMEIFPVLNRKKNMKSGKLSGGEQQMLALARGLMVDPKVLLLDEPSLGLSPKLIKESFAKIKEININHNTTIVIVEHNIKSLFEIVNRVYVLDKGVIVAEGTPREIENSNILERVFTAKGV